MMIEKHISSLLYRYQCVIVPEFGAFLTEIRSARFDEKSRTFFPPQKTISFNANIKHNDGLLANHIAQLTQTPYETVVSNLVREVEMWNKSLAIHKAINLEGIGELAVNTEGNLEFIPSNGTNYLTTSFGLSSVIASNVERNTTTIAEPKVVALPAKRKTRYHVMRYAAVFAICASLGGMIIENEFNSKIEDETVLIEKKVQDKVQDEIQKATFFIDTPVSPITLTIKEKAAVKHPYHIVAGAFKSEENAHKAIQQLKAAGFMNATYLTKNKYGLYPVLYGSYTEMAEAQEAMKVIHKKTNADAWILIQ